MRGTDDRSGKLLAYADLEHRCRRAIGFARSVV
jgi:hypothetical protein